MNTSTVDLALYATEIRTAAETLRKMHDGERAETTPQDALAMLQEIPADGRPVEIATAIEALEICLKAKQISGDLFTLASDL